MLGMTALHHAVLGGRIIIVKALLAAGASTLARDKKGRTAVDYAVGDAAAGDAEAERLKKTMLEYREDEETAFFDDVCTAQH
eukprot:3537799-Prymnesium_polylepis.1